MHALSDFSTPRRLELLVAFADLSAFARFVQGREEEEVFQVMAEYYELVGDIVEGAGGRVVKFIGDASLMVFPAERVDDGVLALRALQEQGDRFFAAHGGPCRHVIKAHFGPVIGGMVGAREDKRFDVLGNTVNTAAMLSASASPSRTLALTPQVFRRLSPETRRLFKKHTPPVTYIPVEASHKD
jgi:class 3 adenylate cyclase